MRAWSIAILLLLSTLVITAARRADSDAYAPGQPIAFSHVIHAGDDKLACELCHSDARRSPFAGIAPVARCMGCHRFVNPENPEIVKVRRFWEQKAQIPWIKVYVLPRYVHFNHESHVRANVTCDTCHGDVPHMPRIARVTDLTMGWCVGCHRMKGASDDCLTCHF